jgi:flagellar protein FlaG
MSSVNSLTSGSAQLNVLNSAVGGSAGSVPEQVVQQSIQQSDAEVVAKVANTVIKPSNVSQAAQPTQEVVAKTAQQLESFVASMGRDLSFSVDSTTGYHVVRVTNPQTGEVVRQLPSEELLKIAETMQQTGSGLVNQKA